MSKILTFSTVFPAYHPRAGQRTWFVEKLWKGWLELKLISIPRTVYYEEKYQEHFPCQFTAEENVNNHTPKYHTIRAGHRWKVGDKFSPRIWSGRPYNSPQVVIGPYMELKKVWDIVIDECGVIAVGGFYLGTSVEDQDECYSRLAKNDGLSEEDLLLWFPTGKRFEGQIICWNENIEY